MDLRCREEDEKCYNAVCNISHDGTLMPPLDLRMFFFLLDSVLAGCLLLLELSDALRARAGHEEGGHSVTRLPLVFTIFKVAWNTVKTFLGGCFTTERVCSSQRSLMNGWVNGNIWGWMGGWLDGWCMKAWMDGLMDGYMWRFVLGFYWKLAWVMQSEVRCAIETGSGRLAAARRMKRHPLTCWTHVVGCQRSWSCFLLSGVWGRTWALGQPTGRVWSVWLTAVSDWCVASLTSPGRPPAASKPSEHWPASAHVSINHQLFTPLMQIWFCEHRTLMSSESTSSYWLWRFLNSVSWFFSADSTKCSMSVSADSAPSCDWHLSTAWEASR